MNRKTNEEILICCGDLRVLGKREFRQLLRWRDAMKVPTWHIFDLGFGYYQ
jgi:hypothetical protein